MTKAEPIVSIKNSFLTPRVLFEDPHLMVLSKPPGLLSQSEHTGDFNLVDWARNYLNRHYVGLVHRLDRNTSGIMVIAKRTKSAQRLTRALQQGKMSRSYLGWVAGTLPTPRQWTHYLSKNPITNTVSVVSKNGKPSTLTAIPKKTGSWEGILLTLVEFQLETGRSHQIRVQSAHEGYPLLGDKKYGSHTAPSFFPRMALHSFFLEFPHPISGEILKFKDPLPEDLSKPIQVISSISSLSDNDLNSSQKESEK